MENPPGDAHSRERYDASHLALGAKHVACDMLYEMFQK